MSDGTFRTNELPLAAFIEMQGIEVKDFEWAPPSACTFVFPNNLSVKQAAHIFGTGAASVNPRSYIDCYIGLKNRMLASRPDELDPRRKRSAKTA
jgi:hypothetical protein